MTPPPSDPPQDARLGYVIADWQTPELAKRARDSILRLRPGSPIEVVDARAERLGYAAALNRGYLRLQLAAERDGRPMPDCVVALNADVEMLEHDERILHYLDLYEDLAVVGPRQLDANDRIVHAGIVPDPDCGTEWDLDLHHRWWHAPVSDPRASAGSMVEIDVPTVSGSVMYVRAAALEELGGFPEWTSFYYEDTALCYIARHRGWRVLYTGALTWRHLHEGSPLSRADRISRLEIARDRFILECGRAGIPLRLPEPIPVEVSE